MKWETFVHEQSIPIHNILFLKWERVYVVVHARPPCGSRAGVFGSSLQVALLGGAGGGVSCAQPAESGTCVHGALHCRGAGTVCVCVCVVLHSSLRMHVYYPSTSPLPSPPLSFPPLSSPLLPSPLLPSPPLPTLCQDSSIVLRAELVECQLELQQHTLDNVYSKPAVEVRGSAEDSWSGLFMCVCVRACGVCVHVSVCVWSSLLCVMGQPQALPRHAVPHAATILCSVPRSGWVC